MSIKVEKINKIIDNKEIYIYSLSNENGLTARIMNYGGVILSLDIPDKNGDKRDVVLGFGDLDDYTTSTVYFGALVGRCANRIQEAVIEIGGKEYNLVKNDGNNHLHGGKKGFDKQVWNSTIKEDEQGEYLELTYLSKDKEENYPGNLNVTVNYRLNNKNELVIEYKAKSDKDTVVNLTNHSYFNLAGQESGDILNHKLKIYGSYITTADEESIPRGEIRNIKNTPMDFTEFRVVGQSIDDDYDQLNNGHGYDHNWIIDGEEGNLNIVAEVIEDTSGIKMDVYRASGAGGQHINKTSSAVRLTHIPTGIIVACQTERSQFQNRDTAMKMLKSKLLNLKEKEQKDTIDELKGIQMDIAWGSQIRSYVFCPYTLVKDHRTNYEVGNVQAVMDGDLNGFIDSYLKFNLEK